MVKNPATGDRTSVDHTSREESIVFALILSADEAHELVHRIAVVVRRSEGVLCHSPTGREEDEISHSGPCPTTSINMTL
jgi:hypothetical protein